MMLRDLADGTDGVQLYGNGEIHITSVTHDSRHVTPGSLFVALSGRTVDGLAFVPAALENGAVAVALGMEADFESPLPILRMEHPRRALAHLSAAVCGHPSDRMKTIGITGTNGKTTVASIVSGICGAAGQTQGQIGTNGHRIGERAIPAAFTTPEAPQLQSLLRDMLAAEVETVVMEVSSVGLEEERVSGISFSTAGFLNLTVDHLDYHGDMESYGKAKTRLFTEGVIHGGTAIIGIDDDFGCQLLSDLRTCRTDLNIFSLSLNDATADVHFEQLTCGAGGLSGLLKTPNALLAIESPLLGEFNAYNLAMAVALCQAVGIPDPAIVTGVRSVQVRGRLESVGCERGPEVVVDYAHSPDALQRVIHALRHVCTGQLWCVFGCGGDRDATKRYAMGRAAAHADAVIITNDNPRSEDPAHIAQSAAQGAFDAGLPRVTAPQIGGSFVQLDRRLAIHSTIQMADGGDLVLIAGKGHETYQETAGVRVLFDDVTVARQALAEWCA
jgi:UDP-N-acetylmuramyl-tripeptide synthetase